MLELPSFGPFDSKQMSQTLPNPPDSTTKKFRSPSIFFIYHFLSVYAAQLASEPRPSPFMRSVISRARAECNCEWANSAIINGEGPGLKHHVRVGFGSIVTRRSSPAFQASFQVSEGTNVF